MDADDAGRVVVQVGAGVDLDERAGRAQERFAKRRLDLESEAGRLHRACAFADAFVCPQPRQRQHGRGEQVVLRVEGVRLVAVAQAGSIRFFTTHSSPDGLTHRPIDRADSRAARLNAAAACASPRRA